MSVAGGGQKRTRSERVAAIELPPGQWERAWISLRHRDVLGRITLALVAAAVVCGIIRAWDPPFPWRTGLVPARNITARVRFEDVERTTAAQLQKRNAVPYIFAQDPQRLVELRATLVNKVAELPAFLPFRKDLSGKENLDRFSQSLKAAFEPCERHGLLGPVPPELKDYNQERIEVYPRGRDPRERIAVKLTDVRPDNGEAMRQALREQIQPEKLADAVFAWLRPQVFGATPLATLTFDKPTTVAEQDAAAARAEVAWNEPGDVLVKIGETLDAKKLDLLRQEYRAYLAERPVGLRIARSVAVLLVIFVLFLLCGVYMRYRQRGPLASLGRLTGMLLLGTLAVGLARAVSGDAWRAELVPLVLFAMTMAIAYRQELALLLSGVLSWIIVVALGHGLPAFLLLFGTAAAALLSLGRIRSRSKLIYVGAFSGGVAALLTVAMNAIDNQPLGLVLLEDAALNGVWALAAGFLMTGLLPLFVEPVFGVLTDLSLLELGDITHPLLQELVRRAPSTYNHSITVGSIAEAAADSIGARGLLCRVGAYFHDIGKMLKPGYFIENQGTAGSRHESLVPAMSTLVIVAHIKDGADLARQHHLPQPIIDLILQHHGTTLVEYFYDRAHEQADTNGGEVDENLFRYPGPKPQTKEAAVLMLADAVESASRTLVDPTPARIEGLVREIAQRRLHGGQFDESGLTLRELRTIERSLVMSVSAIYHGRLKYPEPREQREQRTA